jgi:hypothetical protein
MDDKWVEIEWPAEFPSSLEVIAERAGWNVRLTQAGETQVRLREHGDGRRVRVLRIERLGEIGSPYLRLDRLAAWVQTPIDAQTADRLPAELTRRREGSLPVRLSALRLAFSLTPTDQLPTAIPLLFETHLPELRGSVLYAIEPDERLLYRQIAVARNVLKARRDAELLNQGRTDPTKLEGGLGIQSSDFLGGAALVMPALAAISPIQLGITASRQTGCLVVLFPDGIVSPASINPKSIAELVQPHFLVSPRTDLPQLPSGPIEDAEAFLRWWIRRLNVVLGELVDPATHRSGASFDPNLMLGRFYTLLRLLASVQQTLVSTGTAEFVRMSMLFESMDLAEFLGLGDNVRLATPHRAQRDLWELRQTLRDEPEVAAIVMPRCEAAVKALVDLRTGFRGSTAPPPAKIDDRVRAVVRALRNAKHGLGVGEGSEDLLTLIEHTDAVSPNLADLGWLCLVRLLASHHWTRPGP